MKKNSDIWFPAKKYGWGWGLPVTSQGWAVLIAYILLLSWGCKVFLNQERITEFTLFTLFISGLLIAVCWAKGEKPRWRWGD